MTTSTPIPTPPPPRLVPIDAPLRPANEYHADIASRCRETLAAVRERLARGDGDEEARRRVEAVVGAHGGAPPPTLHPETEAMSLWLLSTPRAQGRAVASAMVHYWIAHSGLPFAVDAWRHAYIEYTSTIEDGVVWLWQFECLPPPEKQARGLLYCRGAGELLRAHLAAATPEVREEAAGKISRRWGATFDAFAMNVLFRRRDWMARDLWDPEEEDMRSFFFQAGPEIVLANLEPNELSKLFTLLTVRECVSIGSTVRDEPEGHDESPFAQQVPDGENLVELLRRHGGEGVRPVVEWLRRVDALIESEPAHREILEAVRESARSSLRFADEAIEAGLASDAPLPEAVTPPPAAAPPAVVAYPATHDGLLRAIRDRAPATVEALLAKGVPVLGRSWSAYRRCQRDPFGTPEDRAILQMVQAAAHAAAEQLEVKPPALSTVETDPMLDLAADRGLAAIRPGVYGQWELDVLLVEAPVEDVASWFAKAVGSPRHEKDVADRPVRDALHLLSVYRLVGSRWTIVPWAIQLGSDHDVLPAHVGAYRATQAEQIARDLAVRALHARYGAFVLYGANGVVEQAKHEPDPLWPERWLATTDYNEFDDVDEDELTEVEAQGWRAVLGPYEARLAELDVLVPASTYGTDGYHVQLVIQGVTRAQVERVDLVVVHEIGTARADLTKPL